MSVAPRSILSTGNWASAISVIVGGFAMRPEWLHDLPPEHLNTGIINAAWVLGMAYVLASFVRAVIARSGQVDAAKVRGDGTVPSPD